MPIPRYKFISIASAHAYVATCGKEVLHMQTMRLPSFHSELDIVVKLNVAVIRQKH